MNLELFISITALIVSSVTVFIAWRIYLKDHERRKKQATIEQYNLLVQMNFDIEAEINTYFGGKEPTLELINSDKHILKIVTFVLSSYERFSVGVNTNIFDFDIIDRMAGSYLIVLYTKFAPYIESIRNKYNRKTSYIEFEELVSKIKSKRSNYRNNEYIKH